MLMHSSAVRHSGWTLRSKQHLTCHITQIPDISLQNKQKKLTHQPLNSSPKVRFTFDLANTQRFHEKHTLQASVLNNRNSPYAAGLNGASLRSRWKRRNTKKSVRLAHSEGKCAQRASAAITNNILKK